MRSFLLCILAILCGLALFMGSRFVIHRYEEHEANRILFQAVFDNDLSRARYALELGADVNEGWDSDDEATPLNKAVANGRLEMTRLLLDNGARVQINGDRGRTMLRHVQGREDAELRSILERALRREVTHEEANSGTN